VAWPTGVIPLPSASAPVGWVALRRTKRIDCQQPTHLAYNPPMIRSRRPKKPRTKTDIRELSPEEAERAGAGRPQKNDTSEDEVEQAEAETVRIRPGKA
jgi:hypothetical protein